MWKPGEGTANMVKTFFYLPSFQVLSLHAALPFKPLRRGLLLQMPLFSRSHFATTLPTESLLPLWRNKEAEVSHVSASSSHLPACCYCAEQWDWGVRVPLMQRSVSAWRVIERNLISPSQAQPPPAAARLWNRGHINHKKVLRGGRSASRPLSDPHFILDRHTLSHKHGPPCCFWISPLLICPSLSFSRNQTILFLALSFPRLSLHPFILSAHSSPSFFCSSRLLLRAPSALRLITSLMEPLY